MDRQEQRDRALIKVAHADGVLTHLHTWGDQCAQGNDRAFAGWADHYRASVEEAEAQGFVFSAFQKDRWEG